MRHSLLAAVVLFVLGAQGCSNSREPAVVEPEHLLVDERPPAPPPPPPVQTERFELAPREHLGGLLESAGFAPTERHAIVEAMRPLVDPRRVRPGQTLVVTRTEEGEFVQASWESSLTNVVDITRDDEGWVAAQRDITLDSEIVPVAVTIEHTLWGAFEAAGEDPALAMLASDVLAWEIDFYRDIRSGDKLELLVEKRSLDGTFVHYGDLRAVRYAGNAGNHEFFRYQNDDVDGWYARDGRSARRAFLKQPLPLVRITSGFGGRNHPILGYVKHHAGVDYGAPTGTPVWAVGDGVVTWSGMKGANGNLISVRHSNGYTSHYAHLSRIASGVRSGARVSQKQVIGYVGTTGRSTGPHLHFALSKDKTFVNPLTQKFPSGTPLPSAHETSFGELVASLETHLTLPGHTLVASDARPSAED